MNPVQKYIVLTHALESALREDRLGELPELFRARDDALAGIPMMPRDGRTEAELIQAEALDAHFQDLLLNHMASLSNDLVAHFKGKRSREAYRRAA